MSGFMPVVFAFSVLPLAVPLTTSHQISNCLLLSTASLSFFLAMILLPLLLIINSTRSLGPASARFIDHLAIATLVSSFATLALAFPNWNKLSHRTVGWAIHAGLICFATSMLYKLIRKKFASCRNRCLNVAFLALCIAFAGLYTDPLFYLPGTIPCNSIIHQANCIYQFALVPVTFVLGSVLVMFSVAPPAEQLLPFVSVTFKEGLTVSTVAVGMTTMIIGASFAICGALVNLAVAGGFVAGGLKEP